MGVRKEHLVKEGNISDTLNAGERIKIINKTDQVMAVDGYKEYWYKISYLESTSVTNLEIDLIR